MHSKISFQRGSRSNMWLVFALGSAIFAALTSILAKIGIDGVNSNLATAIRTVVVVAMAWGIVFILSGLATGASWLCYYYALKIGRATDVVPVDKLSVVITLVLAAVLLHEQLTLKSVFGAALITVGTLVMVL